MAHGAEPWSFAAGQPVSVVAMGGSITCGGNTRSEDEHWSYRVFQWINSTFPHANHTYLNSCKPATPSFVVGACLRDYIPDQVDLVLFEVLPNLPHDLVSCRAACFALISRHKHHAPTLKKHCSAAH